MAARKLLDDLTKQLGRANDLHKEANAHYERATKLLTKLSDKFDLLEKECIICYETVRKPIRTPCNHIYCEECINTWLGWKLINEATYLQIFTGAKRRTWNAHSETILMEVLLEFILEIRDKGEAPEQERQLRRILREAKRHHNKILNGSYAHLARHSAAYMWIEMEHERKRSIISKYDDATQRKFARMIVWLHQVAPSDPSSDAWRHLKTWADDEEISQSSNVAQSGYGGR